MSLMRPHGTLVWNVSPTVHLVRSHYSIRWTAFLLKNIMKYTQLKFHVIHHVPHSSSPQPLTDPPPKSQQHSIVHMAHSVRSIGTGGSLVCFHLDFSNSFTNTHTGIQRAVQGPVFHSGQQTRKYNSWITHNSGLTLEEPIPHSHSGIYMAKTHSPHLSASSLMPATTVWFPVNVVVRGMNWDQLGL